MNRNVIIWVLAIILICVAAYTVFSYDPAVKSQPPAKDNNLNPKPVTPAANAAGDFTLTALDGSKVTLSELKGKKVFLNFWATWCPPCRAEMPDIQKLYKESENSGLVILAVNIGEDEATVKSFMDKNGFSFKVLLDQQGDVAKTYQVSAIPASYFINTDGSVSNKHIGSMNLSQMKEYVKALN